MLATILAYGMTLVLSARQLLQPVMCAASTARADAARQPVACRCAKRFVSEQLTFPGLLHALRLEPLDRLLVLCHFIVVLCTP